LRTVRDHILIGKPGSIVFKYQAIVRSSIKWITVLSLVCYLSIVFGKAFTTLTINYTLGLEIVSTTWTMQYVFDNFYIEKWL